MTTLVHSACAMASMLGFQVCGPAAPWNPASLGAWLPASAAKELDADELKWQIADRINGLETAGFMVAEA